MIRYKEGRVAVSATGPYLDSNVDPDFVRCAYFIIVDLSTMKFEAVPNTSLNATYKAGVQAAKIVASKDAQFVLTGKVDLDAFYAFCLLGIQIMTGASGIVRETIERFKDGKLKRFWFNYKPLR